VGSGVAEVGEVEQAERAVRGGCHHPVAVHCVGFKVQVQVMRLF